MKIAVCLWGHESTAYTYTKYPHGEVDFFFYLFKAPSPSSPQITKINPKKIWVLPGIPEGLTTVHLSEQRHWLSGYIYTQCNQHIQEYEAKNNVKYDQYIYSRFQECILDIPAKPGFYCSYLCNYPPLTFLPSYRTVSASYIRIPFTEQMYHQYELPVHHRNALFQTMFKSKVITLEQFQPPPVTPKHVILIPSVIRTSSRPLDYALNRSIYTHEERLDQTIAQCKSVWEAKHPTDQIYLLEGSQLTISDMEKLVPYVDRIILFALDEEGDRYANHHPNKNLYEMYVLTELLSRLPSFSWALKFGGRYSLLDSFSFSPFETTSTFAFKITPSRYSWDGKNIAESVLYSIPFSLKHEFISKYRSALQSMQTSSCSVEQQNYTLFHDHMTPIPNAGIIGRDAVFGIDKVL